MYKALSGAVVQMRRLEVAAQDLSNLNTSGYKGQRLAFTEILGAATPERERIGGMVAMGEQRTDFSQGEIKQTGNAFDLAIDGEGFFAIDSPQGVKYSRQGTFTLSSDGTVTTPLGHALLGEGGPIRISGGKMEITPEGAVLSEAGEVDRILVMRFPDLRRLSKDGRSLFQAPTGQAEAASDFRILQGSLEQANVSPIETMVNLITIQRHFEAYERVMRMMDSATERSITEAAR